MASLAGSERPRRLAPAALPHLVRHFDRLAEVGDRLLESRAAQSLIARLAPPFDREIIEAGLGEMSRDRLRLGHCALRLLEQAFGGAPMECLAAALEQAVVGRVLDQGVLEAIVGTRRRALDKQ
jgi:hypothetical protein